MGCRNLAAFNLSRDQLYGYRLTDIYVKESLVKIPPVKSEVETITSCKNKEYINEYPNGKLQFGVFDREPVSANLGVSIAGVCPVFPDYKDHVSFKAGFYYRVVRGTPIPDKGMLRSITRYIRHYLKLSEIEQMSDEDVSYQNWRCIINFPESRKMEFDVAYDQLQSGNVTKEIYLKVKGFCKEEDYNGEAKYYRTINARSDYFKVDTGPFFKQLEKKFFSMDCFIKKIPQQRRAQYIMDKVYEPGGFYICTDYTSYESGFRSEIMRAIEYEVYHYIGRGHPEFREFWEKIKILQQTNRIHYKSFQAKVPATRMSGEMNTSLGNGIFNFFAFKFACFLQDIEVKGVVEGDDGLNHVDKEPDVRVFEKLGMILKYEKFTDIGDASFCGQVFDPEAMQVVRDPIQTLIKMGWSTTKYINANMQTKKALLRSRAMSALYENPGCPVINVFALKILELTNDSKTVNRTKDIHNKERNTYLRDRYENMYNYIEEKEPDKNKTENEKLFAIFQQPHYLTRILVERKFKITVDEQILTEQRIKEYTELCEFDLPFVRDHATRMNLIANDEYRCRVEPYIPSYNPIPYKFNVEAEDFFDNSKQITCKFKYNASRRRVVVKP